MYCFTEVEIGIIVGLAHIGGLGIGIFISWIVSKEKRKDNQNNNGRR